MDLVYCYACLKIFFEFELIRVKDKIVAGGDRQKVMLCKSCYRDHLLDEVSTRINVEIG